MTTKIKILVFVMAAIFIASFVGQVIHNKKERVRLQENHANAIKEKENELLEKDKELVEYKFTKKELEAYIENSNNQFKDVLQKLNETNIRLRKVTKMVGTVYEFKDTVQVVFNYDSLAQKIKLDQDFKVPFTKITPCLVTKGYHSYQKGSFNFSIDEQTLNDTIISVVSWKRKPIKWLLGLRLGKKQFDTKTFSKCVDPNTIIINVQKKR